jgi:murein DD-endopeptidase MepM/ murein hydrolase activator NlpD
MSLNFRYAPRRRNRLNSLIRLTGAAMLLTGFVAWREGWQPEQTLAALNLETFAPYLNQQFVEAYLPVDLPELPQPLQVKPVETPTVLMVNSRVLENPRSQAYTADLYVSTGKDTIPWPNIAGRTKVEIYTVQSGDSLWSIADQFGLDLDTLRWSNPELERNPDVLSVGTQLRILPVPGVYHLIAPGDTIETIAAQYGIAEADITRYPPNGLFPPYDLEKIEGLIVPFGRKDIIIPKPALSAEFPLAWPIVGTVTGTFDESHPALDIGAPYGSTVYAAEAGTITYADWAQDGFGYTVIIDHGEGRQSWYVHLKGALLPAGNMVNRGTPIGEVGSTGHSTGPHLHFELHIDGERVNPSGYLPGTPQ